MGLAFAQPPKGAEFHNQTLWGQLDGQLRRCKDPAIAYNDAAAWNYAELQHALGCEGSSSSRRRADQHISGQMRCAPVA